jgi:crotonobetainyl-CoA:carnitine CoA-transferase CaiB-like acyl-CoA transferase
MTKEGFMVEVMKGVRILEVAEHTFVPAASAILADWGADVVKVEHPERGDAMRGLASTGVVNLGSGVHVILEHSNRGKRSIGLDLERPEGQEILYDLARRSDVFLTNKPPRVLEKLRITPEDLRRANPRIVYARGSAYGPKGPDADKGGYDSTGFWARGGSAMGATAQDADGVVPQPGPAYGDSIGGLTIATGIVAALFHRDRTGEALVVDVSLLGTGLWAMSAAVALSQQLGVPWRPPGSSGPAAGQDAAAKERSARSDQASAAPGAPGRGGGSGGGGLRNPLTGNYRTKDGRYVTFTMLQAAKYWPAVCEAIGRPELATDERFSSHETLSANAGEAARIVAEALGSATLAEWKERLRDFPGQWAPVQDSLEVADDPQVQANGYLAETKSAEGVPFVLVTTPVQFDGEPAPPRRAPQFHEHGDAILTEELGLSWERVLELKAQGVVA